MREDAEKQQQWLEDLLATRAELAKQAEQTLKDQIHNMEDTHAQEVQLWANMKLQYEAQSEPCPERMTEPPPQSELTIEPTTIPLAATTSDLEHP